MGLKTSLSLYAYTPLSGSSRPLGGYFPQSFTRRKPRKALPSIVTFLAVTLSVLYYFTTERLWRPKGAYLPEHAIDPSALTPGQQKLVLVLPIDKSSQNLCKVTASAIVVGYPPLVLVNWQNDFHTDTKGIGPSQLGKITGYLDYLINQRANKRIAEQYGFFDKDLMQQTIIVSSQKAIYVRPTIMNSGSFIGPAGDMRRYFQRVKERMEEFLDLVEASGRPQAKVLGGDQGIFAEIFGEQEVWRETVKQEDFAEDAPHRDKAIAKRQMLEYHGYFVPLKDSELINEESQKAGVAPPRIKTLPGDILKAEPPLAKVADNELVFAEDTITIIGSGTDYSISMLDATDEYPNAKLIQNDMFPEHFKQLKDLTMPSIFFKVKRTGLLKTWKKYDLVHQRYCPTQFHLEKDSEIVNNHFSLV
ncbi:hypothetical protein P171DRAFT_440166 [Karstenula rhodostoma CBS 690.94]|uniref:Uncharacterized protein n=1 Tax=Karstenula rhodostoma CBS 690.94 TaxID=1392251 RepID=A0A9P4PQZ6_9PLEO|nr:hypothetical protein P171DRAFT_440166 [Karstenula rhodostoma CBS 690.94]